MTDPQNPNNWSDPTYQPPPAAEPWSGAPVSGTTPETGYTYGSPAAYPTTAPAYPAQQYYQQPGYQPQPGYAPGQPYGQPAYVVSQPTNGLAIAAMIVSILGFGPIGAIMGHVARKQIRERNEQGDGFALAGIIIGWITTAFWVVGCGFLVLAVVTSASAVGTAG